MRERRIADKYPKLFQIKVKSMRRPMQKKKTHIRTASSFAASYCVLGCDSLTLEGRHHGQQTALKIVKELQIQDKKLCLLVQGIQDFLQKKRKAL
jgi:hypothetical protein